MSASIKPFAVEQYGTEVGQEWAKWKRNFNYFLEFNEVQDSGRKKKLLLLLAGEQVQDIFENLTDGAENDGQYVMDEYVRLIRKLDNHSESTINVTVERHIFNNMKQQASENLEQFTMRLRAQGKRCDFGEQANGCIRDRLISGCISNEFRREMLKRPNVTLMEAIQQAKIIEAVDAHSKTFKGDSTKIDNPKTNEVSVNKIDQSGCNRCGRSHGIRDCPAFDKPCFHCGKTGHFKSKCRALAKSKREAGPSNSKSNRSRPYDKRSKANQHQQPKTPSNEKISDKVLNLDATANEEQEYIFCIDNKSSSAKNHIGRIGVEIGGVAVELVIDTGSDCNIIDPDTWALLKQRQFKFISMSKNSDQSFKSYGQNKLDVIGVVLAEIKIGNLIKVARFYVVGQRGPPLLGKISAVEWGLVKFNIPPANETIATIATDKRFNTIKGIQLELPIDPSVPPVWQPYRRIPVSLESAVEEKLDELLN